jgi:HNH endonuclease
MGSMALPSAPLRERLFNDFIGGSFFMWIILIATTFEIEHITPRSMGGETNLNNLCLSCPHCNRHKATRQNFLDPETQQVAPLFHPQQQIWHEHFAWDTTTSILIGVTTVGRATIAALEINRPVLVRLRKLWYKLGEHPPK